ncbi:MAG: inositol monophosphatase [Candidatus Pacebacteria bacterium]|nr:inositol monophosphatase [Candidatus Paceibacterota bacterium]
MNLQTLLKIAEDAASKSSKIIMEQYGADNDIQFKLDKSIVTKVDLESEKIILDILKSETPDYSILSEESGLSKIDKSEYMWIVDPLDGTTNYSKKIPFFAVQIALVQNGKVLLGVINLPFENITLSAIKGEGLFVNGKKVERNSETYQNSQTSMLFETYLDKTDLAILEKFKNASASTSIRIINSACTSMVYLALGRANIVIDRVDKPWDLAAGSLLVQEAGGTVTNFKGEEFDVFNPECVATLGVNHSEMLQILNN